LPSVVAHLTTPLLCLYASTGLSPLSFIGLCLGGRSAVIYLSILVSFFSPPFVLYDLRNAEALFLLLSLISSPYILYILCFLFLFL
jgi:hypothetical protein